MINKIDDNDIKDYLHENQPNVPKKSAFDMKRFLDYIPKNVIIPKLNELIDFLNSRLVGHKTEFNGEIFNDYKNNKAIADFSRASGSHSQAGALGYTVVAMDYNNKTFTLDDATGLQEAAEKRLEYSAQLSTNEGGIYAFMCGRVTKVEGNVVTVTQMPIECKNATIKEVDPKANDYEIDFEQNSFFIPRLPLIGHRPLGVCATANGFRCVSTNKYAMSFGDTCSAFAQGAVSGGKDCEARAAASVALGLGLITAMMGQVTLGAYNKPDTTSKFMIGYGTSAADRKNALRVTGDNDLEILGVPIADYVINSPKLSDYLLNSETLTEALDKYVNQSEELKKVTDSYIANSQEIERKINAHLEDYIVEQGTNGIWTYRKWKSGLAECWGRIKVDVIVNTAYGNLYKSGNIGRQTFPFTFIEPPVVNPTLDDNAASGFLMVAGANSNGTTTTQTSNYCIARGTPKDSSSSYFVNYDVKGRWKG